MPRLVYLTGLALLLLAGAFLLTDKLLWPPGVTEANLLRIRVGMTLGEVEAILGEPGVKGDEGEFLVDETALILRDCFDLTHWLGDGTLVYIRFAGQPPRVVRIHRRRWGELMDRLIPRACASPSRAGVASPGPRRGTR